MFARTLISSLPSDTDVKGKKLCNYQGCWYYYNNLQAVFDYQKHFKPLDSDIIVSSYPKSGTTWLKALTVALLHRSKDSLQSHPLTSDSPHGLLSSSPRLFSTHMPLHTLREPLKDSPCKIVYVCRNVKDVLVSLWHFRSKMEKQEAERSSLESIIESFRNGVHTFGPLWDNVLSYWEGSLKDPKHVLFMRYEELKEEPYAQVMRLAEFLGCPFSQEEIRSGSVEKILNLCSLSSLSNLEINKTGISWNNLDHNIYFRKGEVDDWKNHLNTEMVNKIDMIIDEKFQGSGLKNM
ncbi:cytosolic sulfotransferase 1 [Capsella rubella]|uniref:cytosolic sulfotransferase 1 n=1 Tax=Capsella rubella TaxID=81985 RepID=UPI000CD562DE|nr:cytosolic sulfotransferase 1 [Capsella rubella]